MTDIISNNSPVDIQKIKIEPDEECSICCGELVEEIETLPCKHRFHYDCIYNWFQTIIDTKREYGNKCPYCRTPSGYLPFKVDKTYNPQIHGNLPKEVTNPKPKGKEKCKAYTKMGKPCKKIGHYDGYCHIHKKK
jgi:hypothetical protein